MSSAPATDPRAVAIVGVGCRLPGGIDGPDALWRVLCDGGDAVGEVPAERYDAAALHALPPGTLGRIASTRAGVVDGVELLDADVFGLAPREAALLDPQQRMLMETAYEALDDAGLPRDRLAGTATGVFVGAWSNDLENRLFSVPESVDFHATTGTGHYAMSGRLSYLLDVRGPSLTIDTACSSSLVAVHLAVQSLRRGESDLALAGGANVILEPSITVAYSQAGTLAPDGRCKFGDEAADGYVRSDGAAVLVLKRLADAQAAGDRVHAVIRGSAVTNDGRSGDHFVSPGRGGQEDMLRRAYADAAVDPSSVGYVEAHGTGTAVGDPIELEALGAVVGSGRPAGSPCLVGSVKSNIGHTEGAAGVAGVIKAALALRHGELPATLHVLTPNPAVAWDELGLELCRTRRSWPEADRRIAGVSAFGISGSNAHVVLEAPPAAAVAPSPAVAPGPHLLALSAHDEGALRATAARYQELLGSTDAPLAVVAAAAAGRRTPMRDRAAVVADDEDAAIAVLAALADGEPDPGLVTGRSAGIPSRVVFVYPGQGSQWDGMARDLLVEDEVFAASMARVSAAVEAEAGWSPIEVLEGGAGPQRIDDIDVVQPLLFAVQVALTERWRAWGVEPAAVIGHSMGEVAAAHVAGALGLDDAVAVICRRSTLLRRIAGAGAMAVVALPPEEVEAVLDGRPDVVVAVVNGPRSVVIGGDPRAVDELVDRFTAAEVFCRRVQVDVASHTPQVDPLLDELEDALAGLTPAPTTTAFESTVAGEVLPGTALDARYWVRNLRHPVRFGAAAARQVAAGATAFVEISPHPVLAPELAELAGRHGPVRTTGSLRRSEPGRTALLRALASLWVDGVAVDWSAVAGAPTGAVELPAYPWQRSRHWPDGPRRAPAAGGHPLLGHPTVVSTAPGTVVWQTVLGEGSTAYLRDHVVRTAPIVPATAYVAALRAAAAEQLPEGPAGVAVSELCLSAPLPLDGRRAQVVLEPRDGMHWRARVLTPVPGDEDGPWELHAEATVGPAAPPSAGRREMAEVTARLDAGADGSAHQAALRARGLEFGPAFRTVRQLAVGDGRAVARLEAEGGRDVDERTVRLLDGAFQVALAGLPGATGGRTLVPVGADRIVLGADAGAEAWAELTALRSDDDATWVADVVVLDARGDTVATVAGLRLRTLGVDAAAELDHEVTWPVADALEAERVAGTDVGTWVVYAADSTGRDLAAGLRGRGGRCVVVTAGERWGSDGPDRVTVVPGDEEHHRRVLLEAAAADDLAGVVYAWPTALDGDADPAVAELVGVAAPVALLRALGPDATTPRWWVTRGAQRVGDGPVRPAQAPMWGVGRVAAAERAAARSTLVDLDPDGQGADDLLRELLAGGDGQVALRGGRRHVARLERAGRAPALPPPLVATDRHRLAATTPGTLDGVALVAAPPEAVGPRDVEIRIEAAGLNFIDVLKAMGEYPGLEASTSVALGAEAAGRVVAVGAEVEGLVVGDDVVAITPSFESTSLMASHAVVPAGLVRRRPRGVDAVTAGALPAAYATALIALRDLARVGPGERVLVHAGTGGVGLAALAVCRMLGAEVLATAGSEAKRDHLRALGVEHVFDSRTTDFGGEAIAATGGVGVDVVLNSLTGPAIAAGLAALAPGGRFVEIGKRDIHAHAVLDLATLRRNVSFHVLDLAGLAVEHPEVVGAVLGDVVALVADGHLPTLPVVSAPIDAAPEVFRTMARARHVGKLVLTVPEGPLDARRGRFRSDRTYVVTGGLGELGRAVARRAVAEGARHLALLGRSAPGPDVERDLAALRAAGARVQVLAVDVTDPAALEAALDAVRAAGPPIAGVVHAAGVLADATLDNLDADRIHRAVAPKLLGARNLDRATAADDLDHFVLFSSVAAVLGTVGQANYAAGNAYLDALAHHRRRSGRPATSVAWGPWAEIGLAASEDNRGSRLATRGLGGLSTAEGLDALDRALDADRADVVVMRFAASAWIRSEPTAAAFLDHLVDAAPPVEPGRGDLAARIAAEPVALRRRLVEDAVAADLAVVLRLPADRLDRTEPMKALGLDSLMALELRRRLEATTGLTVSATAAFNHPTVVELAAHLTERLVLGDGDDGPDATATAAPAAAAAVDDVVALASDDDLEALLGEELSAIDRLLGSDGPT